MLIFQVIDNYQALGGPKQNFSGEYIIDKTKRLGQWPNDGCHLSNLGYKTVANNVAKVLLSDRKLKSDSIVIS